MEKREAGKRGEEIALSFLKEKGYTILEENFRSPFGEVDIIAKDGRIYVFVEVKMRRTHRFGLPVESITPEKQRRIIKSALFYMKRKGLRNIPIRFDVVSIQWENENYQIRLIKSAFDATENPTY